MAKILKCPGCDRKIRTGKTRDLNKHINLNRNLRKGQCQLALLIMQNVGNVTPEQNTPQIENVTLEQNPLSTPEAERGKCAGSRPPDKRIRNKSKTRNSTSRYFASSSSKQNSMSYQDKTILIHKNIANGFEETIMEAYKRINNEFEAIAKKTNGRIDMHKSGNYTLTTIKFFKETTLAPQKKRYKEETNQYDVNLIYIFEMIKKDASWPIAPGKFHTINSSFTEKWSKFPYEIYKATIEGNPLKKSLQCTRYLRYNPHEIYIHYDLEYARKNGLKVTLMNISPNALIYKRNIRITGKVMFGEWPLGDHVKHIYTDGFIIARKVKLKTGIEIEISNLIIFKENELRSTNSLPDFEKIQQDKKQNTILDTEYPALQIAKKKLSKKSDINLPNEIIIEIFQHL
ncbi:10920_t:CDS:2 [Dentiscutata heterogama]|uniref:10920_t:CDS:1 n=1 Tax=Dentiscutata heterogama TaxID=1316150 RepID=A0ACA9MFH9_9GLOM|nr:10920_t:CDS:2 [Dentiscutata heterogama]